MILNRVRSSILLLIVVYNTLRTIAEQRFVETPSIYQEASSGDDVQLHCKVQDKRGQCIWQKDRKPVGMYPDKYEWANSRNNDCTLLIRRVSLDFDDGFWECQVTSGDFTRQDALTSLPSRLLVRVKPRKPRLEYGGAALGATLMLKEGQEVIISCVSRYGNPPALIKWFIGNDEVESLREQTNATEVDSPKTWAAHSLLRLRGQRENHGLLLRCVTVHPSNLIATSTETRLDIHYSPEVQLETSPQQFTAAPEDSTSFVKLKCFADANPAANIKWFKDSGPLITSDNAMSLTQNKTQLNDTVWGVELRFEPIKRNDAGLYMCKAANIIGESIPASYRLDVQYGPKFKKVDYTALNDSSVGLEETVLLGSTVEPFECPEYEANPPTQYRWVHLRGSATETIEYHVQNKGGGRRLRLSNIMWSDEGEYRCIAFNTINGVKRETATDMQYILHVIGPPEIQARPSTGERGFYESIGWAGELVHRLKSRLCSRPPPRLVAWQWGSSHIRAGENIQPKYEALPLEPIIENKIVTNCYWAKLEIKDLQKEDARIYSLLVESEKGRDSTNIKLIVRDPTEIRIIAAGAAVTLLFVLLLISIGIYFLLRIRNRRYRQEEEEEEEGSIPADALYGNSASMDRQKSIEPSYVKNSSMKRSSLETSQSTAYDHIVRSTCAMSPEALKVRRTPAVLQPPTIV